MQSEIAHAFASLTTGIYVLTVAEKGRVHGMSSSWVTPVSGEPPLLMAAVDNAHFTNPVIMRTRAFGLNVVGHRGKALEDYFYSAAARRGDNLDSIDFELSPVLRVPWLVRAMVAIEARVVSSVAAGDHTLFVGEPVTVRLNSGEKPLTSLELDYVYVGGKQVIPRDRTGWASA